MEENWLQESTCVGTRLVTILDFTLRYDILKNIDFRYHFRYHATTEIVSAKKCFFFLFKTILKSNLSAAQHSPNTSSASSRSLLWIEELLPCNRMWPCWSIGQWCMKRRDSPEDCPGFRYFDTRENSYRIVFFFPQDRYLSINRYFWQHYSH